MQLTPIPLESYPVTNLSSVVEESKPNMMVIEEPSPYKQSSPDDQIDAGLLNKFSPTKL